MVLKVGHFGKGPGRSVKGFVRPGDFQKDRLMYSDRPRKDPSQVSVGLQVFKVDRKS